MTKLGVRVTGGLRFGKWDSLSRKSEQKPTLEIGELDSRREILKLGWVERCLCRKSRKIKTVSSTGRHRMRHTVNSDVRGKKRQKEKDPKP